MITVTDPLTVTGVYTYDLAGRLVGSANAQGLATALSYDAANQLTGVSYHAGTPNVSYTYTPLGQRAAMTDGTGTSSYSYDSLDRLTAVQNGAGTTVNYAYDLGNRLLTLNIPSVYTVTRGYDTADRLTSVTDWGSHTSSFGYDAASNLTSLTYPGGRIVAGYSYDPRGQRSGLAYTDTLTSGVLFAQSYTHDAVGVLSTTTETALGTDTYGYDGRDRLTGDVRSGVTTSTRGWGYDGATEIVTTTTTLGAGTPVTSTRTYNAGDELLSLVAGQGGVTTQNLSLTYSPTGARLTQADSVSGQSTSYSYDQVNRLTQFTLPSPAASRSYGYDGDGLRQSKQPVLCLTSGCSTAYTWDTAGGLARLLQETPPGAAPTSYVYGPGGRLLEQVQGSTAYYYVTDRLGSVRQVILGDGTLQASYQYDAYGQTTSSTGSVANPFRYTGEYQDSESGFYYLRARYYDPSTHQFLTRDPLLTVTGQAYNYAAGSPLNATDPSGLAQGIGGDGGDNPGEALWWYEVHHRGVLDKPSAICVFLNICSPGEQAWQAAMQANQIKYEAHCASVPTDPQCHQLALGIVLFLPNGDPFLCPDGAGGGGGSALTVQDILDNPYLLDGKLPQDVAKELGNTPGWQEESLGQGTHQGQGWLLRQRTPQGNITGRMIRWHPGGGHHGPEPYWTVTSGEGGVIRVGPQFPHP